MKYRHYSPSAPVTLIDVQPLLERLAGGGSSSGGSSHAAASASNGGGSGAGVGVGAPTPVAGLVNGVSSSSESSASSSSSQGDGGGCSCSGRVREALRCAADGAAAALLRQGAARVAVLRTSCGAGQQPGWVQRPAGGPGLPQAGGVVVQYALGSMDEPAVVARELFAGLRWADAEGADAIVVEGVGEQHEGLAVMNRLRKAASSVVAVESIQ